MNNENISIQDRSKLFAIRAIKAYTELNKRHFDDAGKVLAKQFLRASTSIGANLAQRACPHVGEFAQSRADFISKYSIALKEASETRYWIDIMIQSGIISEKKFSSMIDEINRIIRILISTIKKLKDK